MSFPSESTKNTASWNSDREPELSGSPAPETLTGTGFRMGRGNGR
jgi:hypothetical protein